MTDTADTTQSHSVRPLIAGNWKMNGTKVALNEALAVNDALSAQQGEGAADVMICPPATLLMVMAEILAKGPVAIGGQDCHVNESGAHTGDISAPMLKDAGATAVIVGHSERREDCSETDALVRAKAMAAHRAGLIAIICIGETAGQRRAGLTLKIVARQLSGSLPENVNAGNTVIAYEPVWAIGTGMVPTTDDVKEVHAMIRSALTVRDPVDGSKIRILYGGSVKPSNANELMAIENVDGALVGGASLKANDFLGIIAAYQS